MIHITTKLKPKIKKIAGCSDHIVKNSMSDYVITPDGCLTVRRDAVKAIQV